MYIEDLSLLVSPSGQPLEVTDITETADDGEIIQAHLISSAGERFVVTNGIPRFVENKLIEDNPTWNYKWEVLDGGVGYNFRIIDKNDPAYQIHDIFDRNDHGGNAYRKARDGVALDLGCGSGQYSVKLALEHGPRKVVAMDLTGGVDVFRKILRERYPELKRKFLVVQASVFEMPFRPETFDLVMSLGVLMHTGDTREALNNACKLVKPDGDLNVWIYCSEPLAYDVAEPDREGALSISTLKPFLRRWRWPAFWIRYFRTVNHELVVRTLRALSSDRYVALSKKRGLRWLNGIFMNVDHPDQGYRLINLYDGYVNRWMDTWNEHELFPILKSNSIALKGIGDWRIGLWGTKLTDFYEDETNIE